MRGLLDSIATLVGPAGAAVLLAVGAPAAVLFMAAGAAGVAAVLIAALRYEEPPRLTRKIESALYRRRSYPRFRTQHQ